MLEIKIGLNPMEVRCDHCQALCTLESASADGVTTEVRCSDCGHVIMVGQQAAATPPSSSGPATPRTDADEWRIETAHGRSHCFHDRATLHRWIIERRLTREDRISQNGQPWQRMGDVAEFVPFFDICDSAERARRADTPSPKVLASPPPPPAAEPVPLSSPAALQRGALPEVEERSQTAIVPFPPFRFAFLLKLVVMTAVAAIVAYAGIALYNCRSRPMEISSPRAPGNMPASNEVMGAPPTQPAPPLVVVEAVAETDSAEPRGLGGKPTASEGSGAKPPSLSKKPRSPGRPVAAKIGRRAKASAAGPKPGTPQALAAQGYVALNRRQYEEAISLFNQAIAGSPLNGTALFGIAEAYQQSGQKAQAQRSYRRYLRLIPNGPDANSARTQLKLLEGGKN
jgi:predicted Zn finger-like uncharacterized protein